MAYQPNKRTPFFNSYPRGNLLCSSILPVSPPLLLFFATSSFVSFFQSRFGKLLLPQYNQFESLYEALGLNVECNASARAHLHFGPSDRAFRPPVLQVLADDITFFVDYAHGSDSAPGTIGKPLKTIAAALALAQRESGPVTILLRGGTHYVTHTLQLSANSSGLTLQNYNGKIGQLCISSELLGTCDAVLICVRLAGEHAIVSGGKLLQTAWKPLSQTSKVPDTWVPLDAEGHVSNQNWHDASAELVRLQSAASERECRRLCTAHSACRAYAWFGKKNCFCQTCGLGPRTI